MNKESIDEAKALCKDKVGEIWEGIDFNGNNIISVAETHKFFQEQTEKYPVLKELIDPNTGKCRQPPLIRAWAKVTGYVGGGHSYTAGHEDGFIHKSEFKRYLHLCFLFNELFLVFEDVADGDRRVSKDEFLANVKKYLPDATEESLGKAYDTMDTNKGGQLLFDEFARYIVAELGY